MQSAEIYLGFLIALLGTTCRRSAFLRLVGHSCDDFYEGAVIDVEFSLDALSNVGKEATSMCQAIFEGNQKEVIKQASTVSLFHFHVSTMNTCLTAEG